MGRRIRRLDTKSEWEWEWESRLSHSHSHSHSYRGGTVSVRLYFASSVLTDRAADMKAFASVMSRVSSSLQTRPAAELEKELAIVRAFAGQAKHRIQANFDRIDDNDDDDIKALADHAVASEGYPWDVL